MRIIEEYNDNDYQVELISVKSAKYIGDYAIRITFTDGNNRLVDFKPFLENSSHPSIRKYLDENKFCGYKIVDGNLNWNDYDMIFPIEDIYDGTI